MPATKVAKFLFKKSTLIKVDQLKDLILLMYFVILSEIHLKGGAYERLS